MPIPCAKTSSGYCFLASPGGQKTWSDDEPPGHRHVLLGNENTASLAGGGGLAPLIEYFRHGRASSGNQHTAADSVDRGQNRGVAPSMDAVIQPLHVTCLHFARITWQTSDRPTFLVSNVVMIAPSQCGIQCDEPHATPSFVRTCAHNPRTGATTADDVRSRAGRGPTQDHDNPAPSSQARGAPTGSRAGAPSAKATRLAASCAAAAPRRCRHARVPAASNHATADADCARAGGAAHGRGRLTSPASFAGKSSDTQ